MAMKKVVKPTSKKKNNDKNLEQTFKAGEAARKSKGSSPSAGTRTQTA